MVRELLRSSALIAIGFATAAQAQPVQPAPTKTPGDAAETVKPQAESQPQAQTAAEPGIEDIVVTARRRVENLQNVPVSVTALSGEALRTRGVTSVLDLAATTPSLTPTSIFSSSTINFTLRGQAPENNSLGNTPTVEIYFAEVPQIFPSQAQIYDVESVQVIRGPSGTLFGRASNGGAVLFTPTRPGDDLQGYVSGQYGNYDNIEVEGAATIPIAADLLSARVAGKIVRRDGYTKILNQDNFDLDDRHSDAFRVSVAFKPSDTISNDLIFDYSNIDQHQGSWLLLAARPTGLASRILNPANPAFQQFLAQNPDLAAIPGVAGGIQTYLQTVQQLGRRRVYYNADKSFLIYKNKTQNLINKTEIELGDDVTLKNIFGYQTMSLFLGYEADATPFPLLDSYEASIAPKSRAMKKHQYSEEVQLSGKLFGGKLDFLVGGYYQDRKDDVPGNTIFGAALGILGSAPTSLNTIKEKSRAIFTQETLHITDDLRVTAGIRHTWDKIDAQQRAIRTPLNRRGVAIGPTVCTGTGQVAVANALNCTGPLSRLRPDGTNWTLGVDYQIADRVLGYASAKHGYRAGGVSTTAALAALREFDPESITEYEVGLKTDFRVAGVATRFNIAGFWQTIKDAQRGYAILNPLNNQAQSININAEKATVKGIEVESEAIFSEHFRVGVFGDYTDAGYSRFDVPIIGIDPSSPDGLSIVGTFDASENPFPNVPKYHFGANATVTLPMPEDIGEISFHANYLYQSKFTFATDVINESEAVSPGHGLVNVRLDWREAFGRPVDIGFFAKNLFDKGYIRGGIGLQQLLGITQSTPGEPRTYGIQVRYRFGS